MFFALLLIKLFFLDAVDAVESFVSVFSSAVSFALFFASAFCPASDADATAFSAMVLVKSWMDPLLELMRSLYSCHASEPLVTVFCSSFSFLFCLMMLEIWDCAFLFNLE